MANIPGKKVTPSQLPTLKLKNGKTYYVDERLRQEKSVNDPMVSVYIFEV